MTADHTGTPRAELVEFPSRGVVCRGLWFPAAGDALRGGGGVPAVVMAHGLAGTVDSGLVPFARALAGAGIAVLAFDYRRFGRSGGQPRQVVDVAGQHDDYRAALEYVVGRSEVDAERVALWGTSMSGGHVLDVAVDHPDVAAVVALVPMFDGPAAATRSVTQGHLCGTVQTGARAMAGMAVGAIRGAEPMMPVVGPPGSPAAMTVDGFEAAYLSFAGPTWRNEVGVSIGAVIGRVRPSRRAARLEVPILVQIADLDRAVPAHSTARTAFAARAEVRHYPGDHVDMYPGRPHFERAARHQVLFLARHLAP